MFLGLDIELKDLTLEDLLSKDPFLKKATQLDRLDGLIFDTRDYYLDDRSFWHQVLVCQVHSKDSYLLSDIQHIVQHNNFIKGSKQNMDEKLSR